MEGIKGVTIKGPEGDEKIFVHVERLYGLVNSSLYNDLDRNSSEFEGSDGRHVIISRRDAAVVERRDLVFMKERSPEDAKLEATKVERVIKCKHSIPHSPLIIKPY